MPGVVRKYKWKVVLPDYSWVCIYSRVGVVRKYNFLGLYILTTPALLYNWTQE